MPAQHLHCPRDLQYRGIPYPLSCDQLSQRNMFLLRANMSANTSCHQYLNEHKKVFFQFLIHFWHFLLQLARLFFMLWVMKYEGEKRIFNVGPEVVQKKVTFEGLEWIQIELDFSKVSSGSMKVVLPLLHMHKYRK